MLGHKLVQQWQKFFDVYTTIRTEFKNVEKLLIFNRLKTFERIEINEINKVAEVVQIVQPNVIINAVGIIKQVPSSKDTIKTLMTNSIFPHQLAQIAAAANARLITISTDCVFRGDKGNYNENDIPDADDLYGKSKNLGEVTGENALTVRSSIIGREINSAHSLVEWFLSNRGGKVKGFEQAIYSGFPTKIFARILAEIIVDHPRLNGLYHVSSDPINKYDLLNLINDRYQARVDIERSDELRIDRSLDSSKFRKETGFQPASWEEMIEEMAADETPYDDWRK